MYVKLVVTCIHEIYIYIKIIIIVAVFLVQSYCTTHCYSTAQYFSELQGIVLYSVQYCNVQQVTILREESVLSGLTLNCFLYSVQNCTVLLSTSLVQHFNVGQV